MLLMPRRRYDCRLSASLSELLRMINTYCEACLRYLHDSSLAQISLLKEEAAHLVKQRELRCCEEGFQTVKGSPNLSVSHIELKVELPHIYTWYIVRVFSTVELGLELKGKLGGKKHLKDNEQLILRMKATRKEIP